MTDVETHLAAKRRRRDDLNYTLHYGPGSSDPARRDQIQVEVQALNDEIRALESVYAKGKSDEPLRPLEMQLEQLTRIVQGDQALGLQGIQQAVRSLQMASEQMQAAMALMRTEMRQFKILVVVIGAIFLMAAAGQTWVMLTVVR